MAAGKDTPKFESNIHARGLERIGTETGQAQYALITAAEILAEARQKADESKYEEALVLSRDAMRMASSAILFKDGFVAADFESSIIYLHSSYGEKVPVADWKEVENLSRSSVVDRIGAIFGMGKGKLEDSAKKAMDMAERFIEAAGALVGPMPGEMPGEAEGESMLEEKEADAGEQPETIGGAA